MTGTDGVKSFETLDVQVKALEGDVRDIKTSIASLGAEVRQALTNVTSQFAMQQRTPWVAIGSVLSVVLMLAGFMAYQTLDPIHADIKSLKDIIVPRAELTMRADLNNRRLSEIETTLRVLDQRKYEEMVREMDRLRTKN